MGELERLVGRRNALKLFWRLMTFPSYADYARWEYWLDYIEANRN